MSQETGLYLNLTFTAVSPYTDIALGILQPKPITQAQKVELDRLVKSGFRAGGGTTERR